MRLFAKGKKDGADAAPQAPSFQPIDRGGLLGLLDQVVNGGQSGVLELREPRGTWVYAFQAGALTHASGGRVRGARQAFDLLWEFQSGEFQFTPGVDPALAGNLYIDKSRLLDLLRRSQAVLQGPASPYIAPDQQRPIQQVPQPYSPPAPGQIPTWQPPAQPGQPGQPAWGNGGYPPPPAGYPIPYPNGPYGQGQGAPPQPYAQPYPSAPQPPVFPGPYPAQQMTPPVFPGPYPAQQMTPPVQAPLPQQPQAAPLAPPAAAPAAPSRQATPPSFSVPPMAIPKRKAPAQVYQAPVAPASAIPPVHEALKPAQPTPPKKDDLQSLRASLVAEAPAGRQAPAAPAWGVRSGEGGAATAPPPTKGKRGQSVTADKPKKGKSKLRAALDVRLITFLLWACERKYSPDDHWTLKDAFEVSTMELRDQFIGAFSESFKSRPKATIADDDVDQMAAGRMRGRGRKR
ncbi:MAG TPA: hypothetical protein VIO62_10370 [Candidatus Dormibacteraeota bacterium]|jgi:hypothetical protein